VETGVGVGDGDAVGDGDGDTVGIVVGVGEGDAPRRLRGGLTAATRTTFEELQFGSLVGDDEGVGFAGSEPPAPDPPPQALAATRT